MARRRLNKKVAIISGIVFVFLAVSIMGLIFYRSRNPSRFIADGDKAMEAKDYSSAASSYAKALGRARADSLKLEVLFKLADVYLQTNDWGRAAGCWDRIVQIDPGNAQARLEKLRYFYAIADSGANTYWQNVETQVTEFLNEVDKSVLSDSLSNWKTFDTTEKAVAKRIDSFLYLLRGRAYLEKARSKQEASTEETYTKAIQDFQKVLEIEPNNVDVYSYLAQTIILQGQEQALKGYPAQKEKAVADAIALLNRCVELSANDPKAYLNLLGTKLAIADQNSIDDVKKLEPEYQSLIQKFSTNAEAYAYLANFYLILGPQQIDKAAQAIEKALELDKNNIIYAQAAAITYLYQFAIHNRQSPQIFTKSVETAKIASQMPEAQDTPGPRRWAYIRNRLSIYEFLANRYIEQILFPFETVSEQKKQQLIKETEDAVYQIQQIIGSGENPAVVKWMGLLDLARGNTASGVQKLNTIYERAGGTSEARVGLDPIVPYALAKVYENSNEQGSVIAFLASAINSGIARWSRPQALLEYCEAALKLEFWPTVVSNANLYEQLFGANQRSRFLKIFAHIGAGQYEDAQKLLAVEPENDVNTIKLNITLVRAKIDQVRSSILQAQMEGTANGVYQAEPNSLKSQIAAKENMLMNDLAGFNDTLAKLVAKLASVSADAVEEAYVSAVCENYLADGKINEAKELVDMIAKNAPANRTAKFYQRLLSEPQPDKLSMEKRREIEEQTYKDITEPLDRAMNLGMFYKRNNELTKATEQFKIVLGDYLQTDVAIDKLRNEKTFFQKMAAVDYLFNAALQAKDWQLAADIQAAAERKNLDDCEGKFYAARLAIAKKDKSALSLLDDCLKQRLIFSYCYLLRSNVRSTMGDEKEAIDDAKKAVAQNPKDGIIAKNLASLLFKRNQRLGKSVTNDQKDELKTALDLAMRVNIGDIVLLSFYAEFISPTDPVKALAIRQFLLQQLPSVENAVLLGRMATRMAQNLADQNEKTALFNIASRAFERGRAIEPTSQQLLYSIADMYKAMGQAQKAEDIIKESKDQTLLWTLYYQNGQYDQAQKVLTDLYQNSPKDIKVLRGLLSVSEKMYNSEDAKRYGQALLNVEDNVENRLLQIQAYLNTGLVSEAEKLLQALKEKFPDEPKAQYVEAWLLTAQGKLDKGLDAVNQSLEKDKSYAPAWQLRGRIYLMQANFVKAITDFDKCKLLSDDPITSILQARAFLGMGRDENAIVELKSVIDNPQVETDARVLLENIYIRLRRTADLKALYSDILNKNPDNIFWLNRAGGFALSVSDFKSAESVYEKAIKKSIERGKINPTVFNGYLEALLLSGQTDKLFQEANKHLDDNDLAPVALMEMADAENRRGNKEKAIRYARDAAEKAKSNEATFYQILRLMPQIIGQKDTEDYCNEKLRENPSLLPPLQMLYQLQLLAGDYQKAIESVDKCIEITKGDPNRKIGFVIQKADIFYTAYNKTSDKNFLEKAASEYESLLKEIPKNTSAGIMNNLAYMLAASDERLDDALNYAKQAYQMRPNNPDYLDTYAFVLYKAGKYSDAEQSIQSAIQLFSAQQRMASWSTYEHAGMIMEKLGSRLQAVAAYKQALLAGTKEMTEADKARINATIEQLSKENQ